MKDPTLTFLEQVRYNLDFVDYDLIYKSIDDLCSRGMFIPTALLKKGWFIDRVRINKPNEIFKNIEQVSYIHDKDTLENYVDFGRANKPKQAVFYGSISSNQIEESIVTAYFETSELLRNIDLRTLDKYTNLEEIFTLSRWRILEDIEVIEMIFSDKALKVNEYNRLSLKNQVKRYKHLPIANQCESQGRLFSNEFARDDIKKGEQFKYKISAAYFNYISANTDFKGITYPSVSSAYKGQNVALLPEVVDKYLKLEVVGMFKFEIKNGINLPIDSFKIATELGENAMDFKWVKYVGAEQNE